MKRKWLLPVALAAITLLSTMVVSVVALGKTADSTRVAFTVDPAKAISIRYLPSLLSVPLVGGAYRPSAVIITHDGSTWRAFSNRTMPFGCLVRPDDSSNRMIEVCHGAVYDLTGRNLAGPGRTLFQYPVTMVDVERIEVDLSTPRALTDQLGRPLR